MRYSMPDVVRRVARFLAREGDEVYMREDKLDARDLLVEALTFAREHARATPRLISREREEAGDERERDDDEDEMRHGV